MKARVIVSILSLFIVGELVMPQVFSQAPTSDARSKIQSADYANSVQGVSQAKVEKDVTALRLGLKHPILEIKSRTVDAIRELNIQDTVPDLIVVWMNNQGRSSGGTQFRNAQEEFNQNVARTLAQLTSQSVDKSGTLTTEKIQEIVRNARAWSAKHNLSVPQ